MPIRWDEPFGIVFAEALACGTPVVAFAGARCVSSSSTARWLLVADERAMADAIGHLPRIAADDCRDWVSQNCDGDVVAAAYEQTFRSVALQRPAIELAPVA